MQFINALEERLLDELKEISNKEAQGGEMTAQCLDNIKDISVSLKDLATYQAMRNSSSGYSQDSGYMNNGYSNARGNSMSRGRMVYGDMSSRDGRSYHGGNWDRDDMYSMRMRPDMY